MGQASVSLMAARRKLLPAMFIAGSMVLPLGASAAPVNDGTQDEAIFGKLPLKMEAPKRFFARFGYTYIKPTRKTDAAVDVTGPVIARGDWMRMAQQGLLRNTTRTIVCGTGYAPASALTDHLFPNPADSSQELRVTGAGGCLGTMNQIVSTLDNAMLADGIPGLGIPDGVVADPGSAGTPTVAIGMFLDEDQKWAVEGFVLALPMKHDFFGSGNPAVEGQHLGSTKIFPPFVSLSRYFGAPDARFRFSAGLAATYAIFFDSSASPFLSEFSGGPTTLKLENKFGGGPIFGAQMKLSEKWHLSAQVAYLYLKTKGTITTTNTTFTTDSPVLRAYTTPEVKDAIVETALTLETLQRGVNSLLAQTAAARGGNLGTYVRTIEGDFRPLVFSVSFGYSF